MSRGKHFRVVVSVYADEENFSDLLKKMPWMLFMMAAPRNIGVKKRAELSFRYCVEAWYQNISGLVKHHDVVVTTFETDRGGKHIIMPWCKNIQTG